MDYMQEAIERARAEREGRIGQTNNPGDNRPPTLANPAARAGRVGGAPQLRATSRTQRVPDFSYSETCSVELQGTALRQNRVIAANQNDSRAEVYRQLRSQVLATLRRNGMRTMAITSAHEDAGKTLTAVNLAISISQEVNQTVMLVDLDLRSPSVHRTLGIEVEKGIVDYLANDEPLENIMVNPQLPRFVVVPGLPREQYSSELLTSPAMHDFLDEITRRYSDRLVLFDLPPLLRNDDAMSFAPLVDTCLLVVEDEVTTRRDIERSLQLLSHATLIGTVLNKAR